MGFKDGFEKVAFTPSALRKAFTSAAPVFKPIENSGALKRTITRTAEGGLSYGFARSPKLPGQISPAVKRLQESKRMQAMQQHRSSIHNQLVK